MPVPTTEGPDRNDTASTGVTLLGALALGPVSAYARIVGASYSADESGESDLSTDMPKGEPKLDRRPIGVALIVRTRLYREGLLRILELNPRVEVLGWASDLDDGIARAVVSGADVILLDTGATTSPEALRYAIDALWPTRVVAFGIAESEEVVIRCAEAGVAGYVPHGATLEELVTVLEGVIRDEVVCSPRLAATLLRRVGALARKRGPAPTTDVTRLTSRETQIVALIDEGLSNKEIASRLHIELATVKNHVHHILDKLGVGRRGEAAARIRALRQVADDRLLIPGTGSHLAE
jgi:DNA-binding NarL/FixJ family response regulator